MRLTDSQKTYAAELYDYGIVSLVCALFRVGPDDELRGDLGVKLCEVIAEQGEHKATLPYCFVALCNECRAHRRKLARRATLLPRVTLDGLQIPQPHADPAASLLTDNPEAARVAATGRVGRAGNRSRKQWEINRARLQRMRIEHER